MRSNASTREFRLGNGRFKCSVAAPFIKLRETAQRDTDTRNDLDRTTPFEFAGGNDTEFTVTRCGPHEACVTFSRSQNPPRIRITGYGIPEDLEIRTILNAAGECELVLASDGTRIPVWRILSKALDALFFDDKTDHPR
ncbi:MAG: hypothetical protein OXG04_06370 [Acidobacteria bacterium]|nr:hypothetical protein [Acidobacteriota bacterium]